MNREEDSRYYERRARQERERAERASDTAVQTVHHTLAVEYERRRRRRIGPMLRSSLHTPLKPRPLRGRWPAMGTAVMLLAAASLALGASIAHVALLLSALSVSLVLLVLQGERRRYAMLHSVLDRLGREAGVATSHQDL